MMTAMINALIAFVHDHGVLAVLLLMAAESCGFPFPSEVIMPVGGALAGAGHLNVVAVVLAGTVGNLIGSLVAYALAARFGRPILLGPGRWIGLSRSHLDLADDWFARHGLLAVLVGRVLPVVRTYISFPAGLARVKIGPFSLLTFVGALPWCIALTAGGYVLGANYDKLSAPIEKAAIGFAVLVLAVVVAWFILGRRPERPAAHD
jgi:membrane protein DedA with SNARE-associated domain